MPRVNQNIKRGLTKTLLIILGVIVAALMSFNSSIFTAEDLSVKSPDSTQELELNKVKSTKTSSSSGVNYNSGMRFLRIFTENLPYLNNK
ncbi:MAG: hypothetical protein JXR10_11465 [Cyclobacteriaceae bacterium]